MGRAMITGTLSRYFGMRFLTSVVGSFIGVVALAAMIDYVELMRRGADWPNATAWVLAKISMFRVPQLTERIMPFSVLVGAMSCYLTLSRRLELVVARSAGVSAWQFVAPAMIAAFIFGAVATTVLQSRRRDAARALEASRSRHVGGEPVGVAGEHERFLGAPEKRRWSGHHQCQFKPRARRAARRRQHLHFRWRRPFPTADRGAKRHVGARLLAARRRAHLWQRQSARRRRKLSPRHQSDARAGARELCYARDRAVLAIAHLHRDGGSRRSRRRGLSAAISSSSWRARFCSPRWSCSRPP